MNNKTTKRLTNDLAYQKPTTTYQQTLTNQEIKEKLKEYKQVSDIKTVSIGTHIRYFVENLKTKKNDFRLGGTLQRIDPEGRFVILSNGKITWSVQIQSPKATFYQKMVESEIREELKKELKKEVLAEESEMPDNENALLKKDVKKLTKKIEQYKEIEKKYNLLMTKNEQLSTQLNKIEVEIRKNKNKK
jgi:hypothetical protein